MYERFSNPIRANRNRAFVMYDDEQSPPSNPPTPPANPPAPKTFTQDEVNAMIAAKAKEEVRKLFGTENVEDVKAKLKKADELEEAQKTELQRAIDKATADGRKSAEEEFAAKLAEAELLANRRLIQSEVIAQASALGFRDAEDAWLRADVEIQEQRIKINDKGKVIGVDTWLKKLAAEKPYLLTSSAPGTPILNRGNGSPSEEKLRAAKANVEQMVFGRM